MEKSYFVSVILATYNGERRGFLKEAVESVLNQTYPHYELILVDDGSTDRTKEFCHQYLTHPKFRYLYQKNQGPSLARNLGIKSAQGDFISFLDDDDAYLSQKLEKQIQFFKEKKLQDPKVGLVFCKANLINEHGLKIGEMKHEGSGNVFPKLLNGNFLNSPSSVLISRSVFERGDIFNPLFKIAEDYELWLRIARKYHFYSMNDLLINYRIHSLQATRNLPKIHFYTYLVLKKTLRELPLDSNLKAPLYKRLAILSYRLQRSAKFKAYYQKLKALSRLDFKLRLKYFSLPLICFISLYQRARKYL